MERVVSFEWKSWTAYVVFIAALFSPAPAAGADLGRETLVGLTGVEVLIEQIRSDVESAGLLRSNLQTDVELRLRQAGIRVLTQTEAFDMLGTPVLYLRVNVLSAEGLYAYDILLELREDVRLIRKPTLTLQAMTWNIPGFIGIVGARNLLKEVRETVRDTVDQFINAYLAANPKR